VASPGSSIRNERAIAAAVSELTAAFGNRLVTSQAVRQQHGHTTTWHDNEPPDAVVFPQSTEDVQQIVRICARHGVPVIAFGTGTSLEGHVNAPFGGVSIDMRDMNRVLAVHAEDLDCVIEPGVTRKLLNEHLRDQGLFFPIDPGADASLGGMSATRASGTNAVRYGTMRENVLGLTVVTASGEVIHTGTRARKSAAGYDLTRLFVGSEGTLGVMTEITLRLYPQPEAVSAAVCSFPSVEAAVNTTIQIIQMGVPIARCELLDANAVRAVNRHDGLALREGPMLLMEFHGTTAGVAEQVETVQQLAAEHGGMAFEWAATPEERTRLWTARHHAYFAGLQMRPGCRTVTTDTCVPISRLAECLLDTVAEVDASGLPYYIVGHVGDGNFHVAYLIDPSLPAERETAERLNLQLVQRALRLDGTCTGEHGIGLHKMDFLVSETGAGAVEMMRTVKRALDPKNIMNPGKIFAAA
jgi:D-lactate dehydrogenase (cytochrome)